MLYFHSFYFETPWKVDLLNPAFPVKAAARSCSSTTVQWWPQHLKVSDNPEGLSLHDAQTFWRRFGDVLETFWRWLDVSGGAGRHVKGRSGPQSVGNSFMEELFCFGVSVEGDAHITAACHHSASWQENQSLKDVFRADTNIKELKI